MQPANNPESGCRAGITSHTQGRSSSSPPPSDRGIRITRTEGLACNPRRSACHAFREDNGGKGKGTGNDTGHREPCLPAATVPARRSRKARAAIYHSSRIYHGSQSIMLTWCTRRASATEFVLVVLSASRCRCPVQGGFALEWHHHLQVDVAATSGLAIENLAGCADVGASAPPLRCKAD